MCTLGILDYYFTPLSKKKGQNEIKSGMGFFSGPGPDK